MKYCLISFTNINILPYAKTYIDNILNNENECDLLFWDREALDGIREKSFNCRTICFNRKCLSNSGALKKSIGYIGAIAFFNYILMKEKYDRLVFLETQSAVTSILPILLKYRNKYIIEIRDFSFEKISIYKALEKIAINYAYKNVISSVGYKGFLPRADYLVSHNITYYSQNKINEIRSSLRSNKKPYVIAFVGSVRFFEINKAILNALKNDSRFIVAYYGVGSNILEDYCNDKKINNVLFRYGFAQEETLNQYIGVSAINNIYGNNDPRLDFALSNKLYHAAQLRIPILVSPKTYMEEIASLYNFGCSVDPFVPGMADKLFKWLERVNRERLSNGAEQFLKKVSNETTQYFLMISNFAKGK